MKILAIELSSIRGSFAWREGELAFEVDWANDRKNSGEFFRHLESIKRRFGAPQRIVVGLGPGSYAGTRIAISAAVGLHLATDAELVGLSSLCAIQSDATGYNVVGDARRQSFFLASVRGRSLSAGPVLQSASELEQALREIAGRTPVFSTEPLPQFKDAVVGYPSARILAQLAAEENRAFVLPPLEPMYLREPHITTPKKR